MTTTRLIKACGARQMAEIELLEHVDGALGDPVAADLVPGKARSVDQGDIADAAETERVGGAGAGRSRANHCNGEVSLGRSAAPCPWRASLAWLWARTLSMAPS